MDSEPGQGLAPTTTWTPGATFADSYAIPVSPDAPSGVYTVEVGLYGLVDPARVPVFGPDNRPQGDAVVLSEVEVRATP
jgi:hypothetical protein